MKKKGKNEKKNEKIMKSRFLEMNLLKLYFPTPFFPS